jgi:TldD protein
LGTHRYDYEGTPTRKNYLIKDGILVGRLHSRETAAKMGEAPTGNARSVHFQHPPIVRMTNTYLDVGNAKFEDMLKDVELGVYAIDMMGGQEWVSGAFAWFTGLFPYVQVGKLNVTA